MMRQPQEMFHRPMSGEAFQQFQNLVPFVTGITKRERSPHQMTRRHETAEQSTEPPETESQQRLCRPKTEVARPLPAQNSAAPSMPGPGARRVIMSDVIDLTANLMP